MSKSCTKTASCEDGDHTYSWPCDLAQTGALTEVERKAFEGVPRTILNSVAAVLTLDDLGMEGSPSSVLAHRVMLATYRATLRAHGITGPTN